MRDTGMSSKKILQIYLFLESIGNFRFVDVKKAKRLANEIKQSNPSLL
tara:strand:+ start:1490 stop:1633 length:144 start_codon:yes stop_codon:yes gene_type:complete